MKNEKSFGRPPITEDKAKEREQRRKKLCDLMAEHHIMNLTLADYVGVSKVTIAQLRMGTFPITDKRWENIERAIDQILKDREANPNADKPRIHNKPIESEYKPPKIHKEPRPKVKHMNRIDQYVLDQLARTGNTIIIKKCVKDQESLLAELKEKGFDCRLIDTETSHYTLEDKTKFGEHEMRVEKSRIEDKPQRGRPRKNPIVPPVEEKKVRILSDLDFHNASLGLGGPSPYIPNKPESEMDIPDLMHHLMKKSILSGPTSPMPSPHISIEPTKDVITQNETHPREAAIVRMGELTFQLIDTCQEIMHLYARVIDDPN